jgi:hypothetical protein
MIEVEYHNNNKERYYCSDCGEDVSEFVIRCFSFMDKFKHITTDVLCIECYAKRLPEDITPEMIRYALKINNHVTFG